MQLSYLLQGDKMSNLIEDTNGKVWQECNEDHKRILHRERLCPLCEFKCIAELAAKDFFKEVFGEPR